MSSEPDHPLSYTIPVKTLPVGGRTVTLDATMEECAVLARDFALIDCGRLSATFQISPAGGPLISVRGRISADVTQECSVTLKPVANTVNAEFVEIFTLDPEKTAREVEIDVNDTDPPEPIIGDEIDLGALASEHLALNLDPYPRGPDAQFLDTVSEANGVGNTVSGPFAALQVLKTGEN